MKTSPFKINYFTFLKLPAAWWCGVRVSSVNEESCVAFVKHRWINQNPFRSMFWAVQGMAAELTTGALVSAGIRRSGYPVSMLVARNQATFTKKATGKITFICNDGILVSEALSDTIKTGQAQCLRMHSEGRDEAGDQVSVFDFEWSLKLRTMK